MIDREKVIKGIQECDLNGGLIGNCPYKGILALLKEQEEMLVEYSAFGGMKYGGCPRCNAQIDNLVNPKACGFCGQAVKWDD